jgi:hypothetical protein
VQRFGAVHVGEIEQRLSVAVRDEVLVGSDGLIQELLDSAEDVGDIGSLGVGGNAISKVSGDRSHTAELVGPLVGEDGLVDAFDECATGEEGNLFLVVDHEHFDRLLPGSDQREAFEASESVEVNVPFGAEDRSSSTAARNASTRALFSSTGTSPALAPTA